VSQAHAGAVPPYPRVSPCRHCGLAVLRDNDGNWIHASLSYACRDRWGGLCGTTAQPTSPTADRTVATRSYGPESWSAARQSHSDTV